MNPGDMVQDRYELAERLGRGGMGQVWSARDVRLERTVALKVISPGLAEDPEFLVRFLREAQSVARIAHPNVVNILDFGETGGNPFLVMEYVPGQSVAEMVGEPMEAERARDIVAQAAAAAGAAHDKDIVHRDIKPANILVTSDGRAKLVDFGIASAMGAERITVTGTTIGSPHYISPEQAAGDTATPASDVYSLGVVLYELLSGARPFEGESVAEVAAAHVERDPPPLSSVVAGIDPALETVVMRCLAKPPEDRYPNGAALAAALREGAASPAAAVAPAGTAVLPASGGDTAMLDLADIEDHEEPAPRDSVAKAILIGLVIGLLLLAIFVGVLLLIREDRTGGSVEQGGGQDPAPADTSADVEPQSPPPGDQVEEQPVEEQPPTEEPPASAPEDDGASPGNPAPPSGGGGDLPGERPPGVGGGGPPSP